MPNFEVRITSGAPRAVWTDPADGDRPSRLNADERRPHSYREATVGEPVTLSAVVDGDVGPLDVDLDDPFTWWVAEAPQMPPPSISTPVGQSSVATFTPEHEGHHLVACSRSDGGRWLVPIEAVGT